MVVTVHILPVSHGGNSAHTARLPWWVRYSLFSHGGCVTPCSPTVGVLPACSHGGCTPCLLPWWYSRCAHCWIIPCCTLLGYSSFLLSMVGILLPALHGGYSPVVHIGVLFSRYAHRCVIPPACPMVGYSSCLLPRWGYSCPVVIPRCGLFLSRRLFPGVVNLLIMPRKPATERGCAQE